MACERKAECEPATNYVRWNIVGATFGRKPTSKVMQALILLDGQLHSTTVDGESVLYKISLPENSESEFAELAGYSLTEPEEK